MLSQFHCHLPERNRLEAAETIKLLLVAFTLLPKVETPNESFDSTEQLQRPLSGVVATNCSIVCFIASISWTFGGSNGRFLGFTISAEDKVNAEPKYAGRYLTKPDINRFVGKGHQPP